MNIFVLADQRTGSTVLSNIIGDVIGGNCGEFLNKLPKNIRRSSTSTAAIKQYLIRQSGTTNKDEYAVKIFSSHLIRIKEFRKDDILQKLIQLDSAEIIRLSRKDKIMQAVSLCKAEQTRKWSNNATGTSAKEIYHFRTLANALLRVHLTDTFWDAYISSNGLQVKNLIYEDLVDGESFQIHDHSLVLPKNDGIQRNRSSFEWAEKFRADLQRRGLLDNIQFKSPPRNWRNLALFFKSKLNPSIFDSQ